MHFDSIEDESTVARLLNEVLDAGITLIDTARGYGRSEARIGRHLAHRRDEFVLSTKFGYGIDGEADWTYACVAKGVDRALREMRTEAIDVGFLHSCPLAILERGECTSALFDAVTAGKLRLAGYSGENNELQYALNDARFSVVQASASLVDQANIARLERRKGQGVLIKRSLAGLAWARQERPADYCEGEYWQRWQALGYPPSDLPWPELALRFAAFHAGGDAVLIGSRRIEHVRAAIETLAQGALTPELVDSIRQTFTSTGADWPAIV
jgi:aryl-alcohol dehydrogenase-like predicted oxidoreductase